MFHWLLLAKWWRRDGTPVPDRKFFNALASDDPLAMGYLGAIILVLVARALYRVRR